MSKKLRFVRDVYAPNSGGDKEWETRTDIPQPYVETLAITKALTDLQAFIGNEVVAQAKILGREHDAATIQTELFTGFALPEGNAEGRILKNTVDRTKVTIRQRISEWVVAQKS